MYIPDKNGKTFRVRKKDFLIIKSRFRESIKIHTIGPDFLKIEEPCICSNYGLCIDCPFDKINCAQALYDQMRLAKVNPGPFMVLGDCYYYHGTLTHLTRDLIKIRKRIEYLEDYNKERKN